MIYLDHTATAPVPKAVADAMYAVLTREYANPSSQYAPGVEMKKKLDAWRAVVADSIGCGPDRLVFTSCGTEGDAWAVAAACHHNRRLGRHIVTTAVEHSAVLESCKQRERDGFRVTYVPPDTNGDISPDAVLNAVTPETVLVSVMLVNNELGNGYPVAEIAQGLRVRNPETLLHTDAVQGFFKIPFSARTLGADFISVSAHKIGGPKGIGALYIGPRIPNPRPLFPGGGQEHGWRSGTEATAQIAGFAKAVELRRDHPESPGHAEQLRAYAVERLRSVPDCVIIGGGKNPAPQIVAAALTGWPSQNIVNDLSEQGICISAGSACHKGKPSHVVKALGLPKRTAQSVIRLSFGPETTEAEIDACAEALRRHHDERFPVL